MRSSVHHTSWFSVLLLLLGWQSVQAQAGCEPAGWTGPESWHQPYPAHRVIGPLYAVGGADLSVYLVVTDDGNILINTGLADSTAQIRKSIEAVGRRLEDTRILLTMQAHFDHTAALAEIRDITGAEMWATANDARVLEDGGVSDAQFGHCKYSRFRPVEVDRILEEGDVIELGGIRLSVHEHPGHTEGSSSYSMTVRENDRNYRVLIANMGTINDGKRLLVNPTYPGVADDFAETFRKQKSLAVDVWVAAHGSQYGMNEKYSPGQAYSPDTFVDPAGYLAAVERLESIYRRQLEKEKGN